MVTPRRCRATTRKGQPCQSPPQLESVYCYMHDPANATEAAEARRLGGMRRKRELITQGAYEFESLTTVADIRRLLEIATVDTLGLENGVARNRTLASLAMAAAKLLETGELEERLRSLEAAVLQRSANGPSA